MQVFDHVGVPALGEGDHRRAGRDPDSGGHDGVGAGGRGQVNFQAVDPGLGLVDLPGPGIGHDGVQVVEDVPGILDRGRPPGLGQGRKPVVGVGVVEAEPPQQGAGVEQFDRDTGRTGTMDVGVVDGQGQLPVAGLQGVQGQVPPVVDGEKIAVAPVALAVEHEPGAGVDQALHLVGVDHGVDGPHVVGVGGHCGQPGLLGPAIVSRLLQPERLHAPHETGVGMVGVEGREAPADSVPQVGGVA